MSWDHCLAAASKSSMMCFRDVSGVGYSRVLWGLMNRQCQNLGTQVERWGSEFLYKEIVRLSSFFPDCTTIPIFLKLSTPHF